MVHGFGLEPDVAFHLLMAEYNPRCQPPLLRRLPRVRRLYWARLRDYLIWIASRGAD